MGDSRRPLLLVDVDGVLSLYGAACHAWADIRPGPTLLVSTEPDLGLTAEHVARVRDWIGTLGA